MLGLSDEYIRVSKSKRTNIFYEQYWNNILFFIGDKIRSIINKWKVYRIFGSIYQLQDCYQLHNCLCCS